MAINLQDWKDDDVMTASRLNALNDGIMQQNTRVATFTDLAQIATGMGAYSGTYYVPNTTIANSPMSGWYTVTIIPSTADANAGTIILFSTAYYQDPIIINYGSGALGTQKTIATADTVLKLTGNQTATGNKSFSGNVSIGGTPMNYSTISSVTITGYVSGALQVRKQSGMVSFTSTDLVLTKGATFTLPAGYYPQTQIQAPITGLNSAGTTAGGYMTIGVNGAVTFNSLGFASGNATAYINVNYVAQI